VTFATITTMMKLHALQTVVRMTQIQEHAHLAVPVTFAMFTTMMKLLVPPTVVLMM
jgi:hypothetical protein